MVLQLLAIAPHHFADEGHQVLDGGNLGLECLAGIDEAEDEGGFDLLMKLLLANNIAARFKDAGLQEDAGNAGLGYQLQLAEVALKAVLILQGVGAEDEGDWDHEGLQVVEAVGVQEVL